MTRDEAFDALSDVQNSRQRSFVDAQRIKISDLATATAQQTDFLSPQFELFAWIEFIGDWWVKMQIVFYCPVTGSPVNIHLDK